MDFNDLIQWLKDQTLSLQLNLLGIGFSEYGTMVYNTIKIETLFTSTQS